VPPPQTRPRRAGTERTGQGFDHEFEEERAKKKGRKKA
jgi:hypothetical protein